MAIKTHDEEEPGSARNLSEAAAEDNMESDDKEVGKTKRCDVPTPIARHRRPIEGGFEFRGDAESSSQYLEEDLKHGEPGT